MRVTAVWHEQHLDAVHALFRTAWWSENRTREQVLLALGNASAAMGVEDDDGRLIAFARALSDGPNRAVVFDVIVAPEHRGKGVGRMLMHALLSHPNVSHAESVALWCKPEHVEFYRQLGFTDDVADLRLMLRGDVSGG